MNFNKNRVDQDGRSNNVGRLLDMLIIDLSLSGR